MNIQKLKKQLIVDEGKSLKVYKDSLGYLTVGIGHFVLKSDNLKLGDIITEEKCNELFEKDINKVILDCEILIKDIYQLPENIQLVIANMMFNMGRPTLATFKNFLKFIKSRQWSLAADSMKKSLWYTQVGNRAKRLEESVRNTK